MDGRHRHAAEQVGRGLSGSRISTRAGVDQLYLVGPFMHPGGGVFGAGSAIAIKMGEDLKIDFDKVVWK